MTEDEQEALSFRYVMPRIMRLTSGNIALFIDGEPLKIIEPWDPLDLISAIPTSEDIEAADEALRASRPKSGSKLTSIDLADFGL